MIKELFACPGLARTLSPSILVLMLVTACVGVPEGIRPVERFNVEHYAGQWFEIARFDHSFERGLSNVTATYTLHSDGSLEVINRGFDARHCKWNEAKGRAKLLGTQGEGSFAVSFFWPFRAGYHVIALDRDTYSWALVTSFSREYLWILARQSHLPDDVMTALLDEARRLGFATEKLIVVDHAEATCAKD